LGLVPESLDDLEKRLREGIEKARGLGATEAADNLERYLNGVGGFKQVSSTWLRSFPSVLFAENVNQKRFEVAIKAKCQEITKEGQTLTFEDYFDRPFTANRSSKKEVALYFASGSSTLRSRGKFQITLKEGIYCVSGTVEHHWYDAYNWDKGKIALLPDGTVIRDEDMIRFRDERGAKDFMMESYWFQTMSGKGPTAQISFTWGKVSDGKSSETFEEPAFGKKMTDFLKTLGADRNGTPLPPK
jgi:hypothetical protein